MRLSTIICYFKTESKTTATITKSFNIDPKVIYMNILSSQLLFDIILLFSLKTHSKAAEITNKNYIYSRKM